MVLAQRVNAFTTRTESVEEKKKSEFLHASFEIAAPAIVPCGSYATGLPLRFFLSLLFFSSLVLLSLSVPQRRISFALFFPRIFPSHYLVSTLGNIVALCLSSSQFPFLTSSGTSSVYAEGGFLLHRHQELSKLKDSRRAHIFFAHMPFSSLPLSFSLFLFPRDFPFVSPSPLRLRSLPPPDLGVVSLRCTCRN